MASAVTIEEIVSGVVEYPVKSKPLWVPSLEDVVLPSLQAELVNHFENVELSVQECPDLRSFGCAAKGLCGSPKLIEGGGEPFNHDVRYNRTVNFRMERMAHLAGHGPGSLIMGAGAACKAQLNGHIGELIPSLVIGGNNHTKSARVGLVNREAIIEKDNTFMCGGISNLFVSKGQPGKVLKLKVSKRIGSQPSLPQVIRAGLSKVPGLGGSNQLGMGGVFRMKSGRVKAHVNPDLEVLPENYYDPDQMKCVKDFLQFYSFPGPLLCFTCLWTGEPSDAGGPSLNLRGSGEHTHFWREKGEDGSFDESAGGHYHGDTTHDEVRAKLKGQVAESPERTFYRAAFAT